MEKENIQSHSKGEPSTGEPSQPDSLIDMLGLTVFRWWGMVFRFLVIALVAVLGFQLFNPQDIRDIPFSELTFSLIADNLLSIALILGCIHWFFNFPEQDNPESLSENPYVLWGKAGMLLVAGMLVYWLKFAE